MVATEDRYGKLLQDRQRAFVLWFEEVGMSDVSLVGGENGLQVYVMCELPSNVLLADEFSRVFDGFSIGSNDLTQLTLGLDRDSSLVAHLFDERNHAVKNMLVMAIANGSNFNTSDRESWATTVDS